MFELPPSTASPAELAHLPRVAYVFQIHSHQRPTGLDEGILYGDPVRRMLPTIVHPNEVLDGAVLRGFMGRSVDHVATQNHPMIRALYAQHGRTLWFAGVVRHRRAGDRARAGTLGVHTASSWRDTLGADGAVLTKIGGGAPHVDMAQAAAQCEALGVKTTPSSRTCRPTAAPRACCSSISRARRARERRERQEPLTLPAMDACDRRR